VTRVARSPRGPARSRVVVRAGLAASLASVLAWSAASPVLASGLLPGNNPRSNIAPLPNFLQAGQCTQTSGTWSCTNPCVNSQLSFPQYTNDPACTAYILRAINSARRAEGVDPMVLPTNWFSLTPEQQLFVIADLERTARGLPPYLGLNNALNAEAHHAARADTDPGLAPGFAVGVDPQGYDGMGGTWASGFSTLGADYFWMYDDGWGGSTSNTSNLACTSPTAPGCWAHRDELLGFDPKFNPGVGLLCRICEMGTGFAMTWGYGSFVDLVELPAGAPPPTSFTWSKDVAPFMPVASSTAPKKKATTPKVESRRVAPRTAWVPWVPPATSSLQCVSPKTRHLFGTPACRPRGPTRQGGTP